METVFTPRDHYQAGETAVIMGTGFGVACEVQVDVLRPDGVTETQIATTDFGGGFSADYQVPPPPGILGQYAVAVRGLGGAVLATTTFEDAPAPQFDIAPSHVPTTGTRVFTAIVRNTANAAADTARCIRITTPASVDCYRRDVHRRQRRYDRSLDADDRGQLRPAEDERRRRLRRGDQLEQLGALRDHRERDGRWNEHVDGSDGVHERGLRERRQHRPARRLGRAGAAPPVHRGLP